MSNINPGCPTSPLDLAVAGTPDLAIAETDLWQAILDRNPAFDGIVFYAVHSTGIYCRTTCPSRKPSRSQVSFFRSPADAERQGFRPCKRCQPQMSSPSDPIAETVIAVCRYIESQADRIPTLAELGAHVGFSPAHLQRVFKQRMGVTPFQYADADRIQRFKQHLRQGDSVTEALYEAGYGSSSRLYETATTHLGMAPAAYQHLGRGEEIHYAIVPSALGFLLVAKTDRGLCSVRLGDTAAVLEAELHQEFRDATLRLTDADDQWTQSLLDYLSGIAPLPNLPYDVQATAFQLKVWQALQAIPLGKTVAYSDLAGAIGQPTAVRAVARACATNPIALVIPCHRVTPKAGGVGGYRWGVNRKQAILDLERRYAKQHPSIED